MTNTKKTALQEIPREQIQALCGVYDQVMVRLSRRNVKGQLMTLGKHYVSPETLLNADTWAQEEANGGYGGGKFAFDIYDITTNNSLVPRFEVEVDGPMKVPSRVPGGAPMYMYGEAMPAPAMPMPAQQQAPLPGNIAQQLPGWARGLTPDMQAQVAMTTGLAQPYAPYAQPVARFTSDTVLREQTDEYRNEVADLRKSLALMQQRLEREQQQAAKEREELKEEKRQAERRAEQERNEQRFRELASKIDERARAKPAISGEALAAMVTSAGTIIASLVASGRDREQIAADRHSKTLDIQMQGVQQLMQASMNRDNSGLFELFKNALPVVGPLALQWWESRSPRAQADLVATMAENNITTISMMANLIQQFSEGQGETPWWLPAVQETINGVVQTARELGNRSKEAAGVRPAPAQMPPQATAPQTPTVPPLIAKALEGAENTPGYATAAALFANPAFPADFKSSQWAQILCALHNQQDAAAVADFIANHLIDLENSQAGLPGPIRTLWDHKEPTLVALFRPLPIWAQAERYCRDVIDRVVKLLVESEEGAEEEPVGEEPTEPEQVVDFPAPARRQTVHA